MRQWIGSALVQIVWLVAYSVPSHYLNQGWVIVNWTFTNKFRWDSNQNITKCIHEIAYENIVCVIASILPRAEELIIVCKQGVISSGLVSYGIIMIEIPELQSYPAAPLYCDVNEFSLIAFDCNSYCCSSVSCKKVYISPTHYVPDIKYYIE